MARKKGAETVDIRDMQFTAEEHPEDISLMDAFDLIDEMMEKPDAVKPTEDYFPTVSEVNTFIKMKSKHMIAYMAWLDANLSEEGRQQHKEAVARFNELVNEMEGGNA